MPIKGKLTLKEEGFKRDVIKTKNPTEAAARNYNCKNRHVAEQIAHENMSKPEICQAIEEEFKKEDLTVEWVLKGLKEEAVQKVDKNIRVKSLELIGKHLKMFTEIHENKDTTEKEIPNEPEKRKEEVNNLLDRLNKINERV